MFPIRHALRDELTWTHYRSILRVEQISTLSKDLPSASRILRRISHFCTKCVVTNADC
ncbi:MAG: hypothetical protein JNK77_14635 [Saprospiraceae bacterium]|nr:hypothetical protein [Saprospiraceae bacterium]